MSADDTAAVRAALDGSLAAQRWKPEPQCCDVIVVGQPPSPHTCPQCGTVWTKWDDGGWRPTSAHAVSEPRDTHKVIRDALERALPDAWAYDELAEVVLEAAHCRRSPHRPPTTERP